MELRPSVSQIVEIGRCCKGSCFIPVAWKHRLAHLILIPVKAGIESLNPSDINFFDTVNMEAYYGLFLLFL